ncbi:MAG: nucleoside-diphosphate kinase [Sulfolobales archaeon]|nr:nucleoside-diphosphate kinase [Sulfolobales archaeon]MCX8208840.1 nucleoside-diphosphate kinase [Sulfolobales archaeon]MDW8010205.1 nucleoside-diphosphate kinase [Sulfolobales archaeon]
MTSKKELVLIKPDGVRRGLVGEVIRRLEIKGLKILKLKMLQLTRECAEKLYDVHRGRSFYEDLVKFMSSGPVVAILIEGDESVEVVRVMIGPTDGRKAPPGTIRGDYSTSVLENVVHAADSEERAIYEAKIVFDPECDSLSSS